MEPSYNWQSITEQPPSFKIETNRNLGWWILLAISISVVIHICLYMALGKVEWFKGSEESETDVVWENKSKQLTIDREKLEAALPKPEPEKPEPLEPAKISDLDLVDTQLDEFDLMEQVMEKEVKLTPEVDTAKMFTNERPAVPKKALESISSSLDMSAADVLRSDLRDMREKLLENTVVSTNQTILELNEDDVDNGVDTDEFFRKAASQAFGEDADKFMEGYSSLDGLISGTGGDLPPGEEKILMPTDILFDYNEHTLKEGARLSMMKLAFIVQTNPDAVFVIEGHTDSFGNDEYNLDLSMKRAVAVRNWLVERLQIPTDNMKVMGIGKNRPLVATSGTVEEQALNRRVEIVIRKG